MRKLLVAVALAGFMAVSGLQAAMTIKPITSSDYSGANSGGEFRATQVSASLLAATGNLEGYAASTAGADYFHTFCIEKTETFTPGSTYEVALNNAAIYNNVSGSTDPLSMGTAWLYSRFASGTLTGYNYGSGRTTSATALQLALWWLEGEAGVGDQSANQFITLLPAGWAAFNSALDANGAFGVRAMNLFDVGHLGEYAYRHQDMLVVVPEPTTVLAGSLLLLPFAASAASRFRRNR